MPNAKRGRFTFRLLKVYKVLTCHGRIYLCRIHRRPAFFHSRPAHQRHLWLPWKQNAETIGSAAVAGAHAHTGTHGACENLGICMNTAGDVGGGVESRVTTDVTPGAPLG